jgi:hypothetical protein
MYQRTERPLTDVEREQLNDRLRQANEHLVTSTFYVILLSLFDGLALFACVMVVLGKDRSGTGGRLAGLVAFGIANLVLFLTARVWVGNRRCRRQLRGALEDGQAIVEEVEATAATWVVGYHLQNWFLFTLGDGRLLAVGEGEFPGLNVPLLAPPAGLRLPACFERVLTRRHRVHLGTTVRGLACVTIPESLDLATFLNARTCRKLAVWLDTSPPFPGRLADLRESLTRLISPGQAAPDRQAERPGVTSEESSSFDPCGLLQARIEERFEIDFGPGGLAAELTQRAEGRSRPLTVGELLEVVRRRVPGGASFIARPARPAFLRLRDALVVECGLPRHRIRPSAQLEDLMPRARRADLWARLTQRLGQPLPPLLQGAPPAGFWVVATFGIVLVYAVGVPAVQAIDARAAAGDFAGTSWYGALGCCLVPTSFMAGIALSALLSAHLFRNRFPLQFPAAHATVGQLAQYLAQAAGAEGTAVPWTDEAVWLALRAELAEVLGKLPAEVTEETELSAALGLRLPAREVVEGDGR